MKNNIKLLSLFVASVLSGASAIAEDGAYRDSVSRTDLGFTASVGTSTDEGRFVSSGARFSANYMGSENNDDCFKPSREAYLKGGNERGVLGEIKSSSDRYEIALKDYLQCKAWNGEERTKLLIANLDARYNVIGRTESHLSTDLAARANLFYGISLLRKSEKGCGVYTGIGVRVGAKVGYHSPSKVFGSILPEAGLFCRMGENILATISPSVGLGGLLFENERQGSGYLRFGGVARFAYKNRVTASAAGYYSPSDATSYETHYQTAQFDAGVDVEATRKWVVGVHFESESLSRDGGEPGPAHLNDGAVSAVAAGIF